ncbi:hypothetical protein GCM10007164_04370 [Luteimonas padinae]|nr:hypothetical protein GCM10007164_04370 [Luteimonas padinae]
MRSQVSAGFQSMKKQGPAPCGTKSTGMRAARSAAGALPLPLGEVDGFVFMPDSMVSAPKEQNQALPINT